MSAEILNSPYSTYILAAYGIVIGGLAVFAIAQWRSFVKARRASNQ